MEQFSFKELYDVVLKATYKIEIEGKTFEPNETIAVFDRILISSMSQQKQLKAAHGGFGDRDRVWWESGYEVNFEFTQGIFSKEQWAIMNNWKLFKPKQNQIMLNKRETIESNNEGIIETTEEIFTPLFIYDSEGNKIENYEVIDNQHIKIDKIFENCMVDYWYGYNNFTFYELGQSLTDQTFYLVAKTKIKEDVTGENKTAIIQIPKLKLMSGLSIRLGKNATPVVGTFNGVAIPVGDRYDQRVMEIAILDQDIDNIN